MKHGEKHPTEALYWNTATGRYVKQLRPSSKGTNIGKAKGKAKGKAVGQAKGLVPAKKLEKLRAEHPVTWRSTGWLPVNLTVSRVVADAAKMFKSAAPFDLDKAIALSSLLIVKWCQAIKYDKDNQLYSALHEEGYVNLHSELLQKWVDSSHYRDYVAFFKTADYIRVFEARDGRESYFSNQWSKAYRFNLRLTQKEGDDRMFYRVAYTTPRQLLRLFELKEMGRTKKARQMVRARLEQYTIELATKVDATYFENWALRHPKHFKKRNLLNTYIVLAHGFTEGSISITPQDFYGERFHSGFTNTKKVLRSFIKFDGIMAVEVDITGSQFFFLGSLCRYPDACKAILKRGMESSVLDKIIAKLGQSYDVHPDMREFIDCCLDNSIYDLIIGKFRDKKMNKKKAKKLCFKAFFSNNAQCEKSKAKLRMHFPHVVAFCEEINTCASRLEEAYKQKGIENVPIHSIPQLLQRLESRTLIDRVAQDVIAAKDAVGNTMPFTTVHDSFICHPDDQHLFRETIRNVFENLGLPVPKVSVK